LMTLKAIMMLRLRRFNFQHFSDLFSTQAWNVLHDNPSGTMPTLKKRNRRWKKKT
jgi:hypothetical protein